MADPYTEATRGFEGFDPRAKWDFKQWTNGYGTRAQYPGETINRDEAGRRFDSELEKARGYVKGLGIPLDPGKEAALTDLTYNAGPGWINEGLGTAVKGGDWNTAKTLFAQYNHAGGRVNPTLVSRRTAELPWFDGAPPGDAPPMALGGPKDEPPSYSRTLSQGSPAMPYDSSGRYVPEEAITQQYRYADALQRQPEARSWAGVLANGLGGLGSGLMRSDAQGALQSNQGMMSRALRGVADMPPEQIPRALAQSGVPDLEMAGVKGVIAQGDPNKEYRVRAAQAEQYGLTKGSPEWRDFVLTGKLPESKPIAVPAGGSLYDPQTKKMVSGGDDGDLQNYDETVLGLGPQAPASTPNGAPPAATSSTPPAQPQQPLAPASGPPPQARGAANPSLPNFAGGLPSPGMPVAGQPTAVTGEPMPSMQQTPYTLADPESRAMYRVLKNGGRAATALTKLPGFEQKTEEAKAVGKELGQLQERQRAGMMGVMPIFQQLEDTINGMTEKQFEDSFGPYNMTPYGEHMPFVGGMTAPEAGAAYPGTYGKYKNKEAWDRQNQAVHDIDGLVTAYIGSANRSGMTMSDARQKNFTDTMGRMLKSSSKAEAAKILHDARNIIQSTFGLGSTNQVNVHGQAPPRPPNVPDGSAYSPKLRAWKTPDGQVLDEAGKAMAL